MQVILADTAEAPKDTVETALNWRIALHSLKLKNVSVDLQMPLDSMRLAANIGDASIEDANADLKRQFYGWRKFALTGTAVNYDSGTAAPVEGFDASHIALRDIRIGIDSVMSCRSPADRVICSTEASPVGIRLSTPVWMKKTSFRGSISSYS